MGVQGLWELLAPVGRRVSVETLAGKKLAIDASIWMIQFMKAMRDEKGEMVRNAHILGFFRRICKLLFLRTKPVFVFDGGTPVLKRRTVAARRRHRENACAKIRKTAEKLLLNHLKTKRLEELAEEIKNSKANDDAKGKEAKNDSKGKQVVSSDHESGLGGSSSVQISKKAARPLNQESLDELLAASLAAEEEREFASSEPASSKDAQYEEEDDGDENEEMIFPVTSGKIDPTVLASLPPSMQLDLLGQMRERLMAENRQKYQKIKKTPTKFSELQIQSYLKTVAFRREIDEVQKCAAGRGLGGVQTSRIASEANREFIFSSSFTGDKQMLSSTRVENNGEKVHQAMKKPITSNPVKCNLFTSESKSSAEICVDKVTSDFGHDVETYCDEGGRVRVSRVRGLGIRMTRDLQRNLDLMKEYEQENSRGDIRTDSEPMCTKEVSDGAKAFPGINSHPEAFTGNEENSRNISGKTGTLTQEGSHCSDDLSVLGSKTAIEISFLEDDSGMKDTDDNLFLHLVSGSSTSKLFSESVHSDKSTDEPESECIWEEGVVNEKTGIWEDDQFKESQLSLAEANSCEEEEVDWEEGVCHVPKVVTHCQAEQEKAVSCGSLEEEADIQEAIRRSLQDIERQKSSTMSSANANLGISSEDQNFDGSIHNLAFEESRVSTHLPLERHPERSPSPCATEDGHDQLEYPCRKDVMRTVDSPKDHFPPPPVSGINFDEKSLAIDETNEKLMVSSVIDDSNVRTSHINDVLTEEGFEHQVTQEELCMDALKQAGVAPSLRISREDLAQTSSYIDLETVGNVPDSNLADAHPDHSQASQSSQFFGRRDENAYSQKKSSMGKTVVSIDIMQEEVIAKDSSIPTTEGQPFGGKTTTQEELDNHNVLSEANLDEEISLLRQERVDLGDEQRRLERNAESVSSEMFAECQELLQMFGLPYIIAPMEAEAQCAYMEMTNLVDGVVTDDSDVFLFGARSVYKNIFDDRKYVETYFMKDIENELGLNTETLIRMALLLGSDYTEGVSGIGIVNAIEVVRAFPEEDGLQKFREWIESPDPAILGKLGTPTGGNSKKRSSKPSNNDVDGMRNNAEVSASEETGHEDQPSVNDILHIKDIFMNKHRNVSKNWHLPSSFPSELVVSAYTSPQVDESTESFTWGKPDLFLLRKLCWERFGWNNKKADELLLPVLKEYNKHETQLRLEAFYTFNERFAKIRSQRIKKAVKGITGKFSTELTDDLVQEGSSSRKKRGFTPSALEECKLEHYSDGKTGSTRKAFKQPRRQKTESQDMQSEDGGGKSFILDEGGRNDKSGLSANVRGRRGMGRGRGKGRGKGKGRGREEKPTYESTEGSSSDACNDTGEIEKHIQAPVAISELRRSMRHRKHVKYAEENVEVDDHGSETAAVEQEPVEEGSGVGFGEVSGHKEGDRSPEDNISMDYLLSGGGFCMEEGDAQGDALHPAASSMRYSIDEENKVRVGDASSLDGEAGHPGSLADDSHSRDYLLSGGGFCMDENETQVDTVQPDAGPAKEDLDPDGLILEEPTQENSPVIKNLHALYPEEAEGEGEANLGLRAMPSLRRKKRKV